MADQAKQTVRAFVSIGSNIDPTANNPRALRLLAGQVRLLGLSTFYRTEPIGPAGQPGFVNGVCQIETDIPPRRLKFDVLRGIEAALGRVRSDDRYAPRPIDLDLILYGQVTSTEADLTLPDDDLERPFVLAGLVELDPKLRLPGESEPLSCTRTVGEADTMTAMPVFTRDLIESLKR